MVLTGAGRRVVVGLKGGLLRHRAADARALRRPWNNVAPRLGFLHHSDRGGSTPSAAYRTMLADHGAMASMSRKANRLRQRRHGGLLEHPEERTRPSATLSTHEPRLARPSSTTSKPSTTVPGGTRRSDTKVRSPTNPPSANHQLIRSARVRNIRGSTPWVVD